MLFPKVGFLVQHRQPLMGIGKKCKFLGPPWTHDIRTSRMEASALFFTSFPGDFDPLYNMSALA